MRAVIVQAAELPAGRSLGDPPSRSLPALALHDRLCDVAPRARPQLAPAAYPLNPVPMTPALFARSNARASVQLAVATGLDSADAAQRMTTCDTPFGFVGLQRLGLGTNMHMTPRNR